MPVYFDHNATTPVRPEVREAFSAALAEVYGNASSIHHAGQAARRHLDAARRQVAALLNADAREIVLLSGGTEANNLAIHGAGVSSGRTHLITTSIEHPAVLNPCAQYGDVTYLRTTARGEVDPDDVRRALRPETRLISVMHANNETGVLQPVEEIGRIAREAGVLFHVDGVQAAGKIPVDVRVLEVDLYSISGHKFYGPKGTGALYVRNGVALRPLMQGGRHERERRAGTENVPGAIALGRAAELAAAGLMQEAGRLAGLRDRLEQAILEHVPRTFVNGAGAPRLPNTSNLCFEAIEGEAMVIALDLKGFAVSSGSACSSGAVAPSHVLLAMGLSREDARSSVRFSLGAENSVAQVDALADAAAGAAAHLRRLSPTYRATA